MTKFVSVNTHTIHKNTLRNTVEPPIRIATSRSDDAPAYASEIEIRGKARLVYDPHARIMLCGDRLVLLCDDVEIIK